MYAVVTKDGNVAEFEHEVQTRMYADVTGGAWSEMRIVQVPMCGWKWGKAYGVKEYRLKKTRSGQYLWAGHDVPVRKASLPQIRSTRYADCYIDTLHMRPAISAFSHD